MKNSVFFLYFISSTGFINNVLGLGTQGIINGELGSRDQHKYLAAIFAVQNCLRSPKLIGSGVLVDKRFVISAAHHFVDLTSRGKYKLKPKTFYVHLGSSDLNSELGESVPAETFYLFDYNSTTGQDDMILIQTARPHIVGYSEWEPAYLAREDIRRLKTMEGKVSSHGMHNRQDDIDRKLRFATANIFDTSSCDNIVNKANSQLCIKMNKDNSDRLTGLCTNDGGAPFVVSFENRDYVVGIAGKPKESCDDTEIGSVYTDISYYYVDIVLTITDEALVATQILEQNSRAIGQKKEFATMANDKKRNLLPFLFLANGLHVEAIRPTEKVFHKQQLHMYDMALNLVENNDIHPTYYVILKSRIEPKCKALQVQVDAVIVRHTCVLSEIFMPTGLSYSDLETQKESNRQVIQIQDFQKLVNERGQDQFKLLLL